MGHEASGLLYYLVRDAEQVIQGQGADSGDWTASSMTLTRGTPVDLSPYSAPTDSLLQEHAPPASLTDDCAMMKRRAGRSGRLRFCVEPGQFPGVRGRVTPAR